MKVLLIGSGGREHALAWKLSKSPKLTQLYVAPGNPGIAQLPKTECIAVPADDIHRLLGFAKEHSIDLTFVGPEKPLALGIVDLFRKNKLPIFGPEQAAAKLEASKEFAKEVMVEAGVPTASYKSFSDHENLSEYLRSCPYPIVLKADGLAAGKGVTVCSSWQIAEDFAKQVFVDKVFGDSGHRVIAEEFLDGRECSILAICDGNSYQLLASAQDHKRLLDRDFGPNTGGMGAYSPSPLFTIDLEKTVREQVFEPVFRTLEKKGIQFTGILYAGLMVTKTGPKVLEFNVRFGDPETQVIIPRLENDLLEVLVDAATGNLSKHSLQWKPESCLTVVVAAKGYPDNPEKGRVIAGLAQADPIVFHAGTSLQNGKIITAGGRVLTVTALGKDLIDARTKVYKNISNIQFEGMQYRTDIGKK